MNSSGMDKVRKAAITGAVAAGAASFLFGEAGQTRFLGMAMPTVAAIGLANAGASVAADLSHDYILPHIPQPQQFANIESAALGIGVSGGTTAYLLSSGRIGSETTMNAFLLGAGSYVAGDYIDHTVFRGGSNAFSAYY